VAGGGYVAGDGRLLLYVWKGCAQWWGYQLAVFVVRLEGLRLVTGYQPAVLSALVLKKLHSKNAYAALF